MPGPCDNVNRPLAMPGLISYRHPSPFGWVMIGAKDDDDALSEASRSTANAHRNLLEKWDADQGKYVKVMP